MQWNDDLDVPYQYHLQLLQHSRQGFLPCLLHQALSGQAVSDHVRRLPRMGTTTSAYREPGSSRGVFFDLSGREISAAVVRFDEEGAPCGRASLDREIFLAKDPRFADHLHFVSFLQTLFLTRSCKGLIPPCSALSERYLSNSDHLRLASTAIDSSLPSEGSACTGGLAPPSSTDFGELSRAVPVPVGMPS